MFDPYDGIGFMLLLAGFVVFFVGVIFIALSAHRKAGIILVLVGITSVLIGTSLCSASSAPLIN